MAATAPIHGAHTTRRWQRLTLAAVLVAAAAAVGLIVIRFAISSVNDDHGLTKVSARDAGHDPDFMNAIRTDAHAAPHVDLPEGVLVFTGGSVGGDAAIYAVSPDGTGLSKAGTAPHFTSPVLVPGGSRVNFEPAIPSPFVPASKLSPDGWRLATLDKDGLHVANADGSGSRIVSRGITQVPPMSRIVWSADSRHVFAWGGTGAEYFAGVLADVEDGSSQPIPSRFAPAIAISPSGDRLAYLGPSGALTVSRVDGSGAVDVSDGIEVAAFNLWEAAWSPDGDRIAFSGAHSGAGFAVAAADGSGTVRVTTVPASPETSVRSFVWSPDGSHLAVSGYRDADDHSRVIVFDSHNLSSAPVEFDAGLVRSLNVVPIIWWDDGLGFYFIGRGEYVGEGVGHEAIYSVSLDGKTDVRLSGDINVASMVGVTH